LKRGDEAVTDAIKEEARSRVRDTSLMVDMLFAGTTDQVEYK
jgi:hypothetical protein